MNSPAAVREFFGTVLQQVYHFKVDVIARDAHAAAYKHCKKQEHQDLYGSSVAVMLRDMQREVNTGHPFERKSTNNHPTQLHAADDLDCCFMAVLSWRDDKEEEQTEDNSRERGVESQLRAATEDPMVASANLGEFWSSKTGKSGYDQQIRPGTFPSS